MKTVTTIKTLIISTLLAASMAAAVESVPKTKTFEVMGVDIRMPATHNGTVSLRECDDCDYHSIRVTPKTSYLIDGQNMSLADFKKRLQAMNLQTDVGVNVMRDEASNTVSKIFIYSE